MSVTNPSQYPMQVENVFGTSSLGREIDIDALSEDIHIESKGKGTFSGGVYTPDESSASVLVFRTGKITVAGAASKPDARQGVTEFFDKLDQLGFDTPEPHITFCNVVCRGDIGTQLNLPSVAIHLGLENVEYEPEQFSAVVYWRDDTDSNVTYLIFNTGRVMITGTNSESQARKELKKLASEIDYT
jgi:transcription initiation factor TFIID TATA-box-binding protein